MQAYPYAMSKIYCDILDIYKYDCLHHSSSAFTGLKAIVPLQQPDLKNPATVEHLENI